MRLCLSMFAEVGLPRSVSRNLAVYILQLYTTRLRALLLNMLSS
jgi:hypothetical protein